MKKTMSISFLDFLSIQRELLGSFKAISKKFCNVELILINQIWPYSFCKFIFKNFMLKHFLVAIIFEKKNVG